MIRETSIMELRGLTKYYRSSPGIMDVNLEIKEGEIFGFLGPNGAGKTTTIRLIIGLIKPTKGEISVFGKSGTTNHREIIRNIGYIPGDIGLYTELSGNEYLYHLLKLRTGKSYGNYNENLVSLQSRFNIRFDKKIKTYSKGMRQIVGIIQAFMHNPRLVILDEPTSGLDPFMQEEFFDLILQEKENGKTVFLSSHILSETEKVCDRVGILKKGRLIHVEKMSRYRKMAGKNVKIETPEPPERTVEKLGGIVESRDCKIKNGRIEFYYNGDMQELIGALAQMQIRDFVCETPRIEDLFFRYYEEE
ncbi:MAG: ABC transporter ATP-binding protein [Spirochaetes bacterium]|nr:ABC transporter ATP-binding protein [Spirochaetota bacterium]